MSVQIELTGCTGAGKSTLAAALLQARQDREVDLILGDDFVLSQIRLNGIKPRLARTLLLDVSSFSACLATVRSHFELYSFAIRTVLRLPIGGFEKLNIIRNVLKKIGMYEIIRRNASAGQVVLVDEGTLHAAHNLFVHLSVPPEAEDLATFIRLVPLPDLAVYMTQDKSVLLERTLKRGHKRVRANSDANVERFVERALEVFEALRQHPRLAQRLLVLDGQQPVVAPRHPGDPSVAQALRAIQTGLESGAGAHFKDPQMSRP